MRLHAFGIGVLFALGLGLSGMTLPRKVIGFLDVFGAWDPSLALVMVGAIGVYATGMRLGLAEGRPRLAPAFRLPTRRDIDARLLAGAGLFGVGWGLAGFCPGPGLVTAATGARQSLVFLASMLVGMGLWKLVLALQSRTSATPSVP